MTCPIQVTFSPDLTWPQRCCQPVFCTFLSSFSIHSPEDSSLVLFISSSALVTSVCFLVLSVHKSLLFLKDVVPGWPHFLLSVCLHIQDGDDHIPFPAQPHCWNPDPPCRSWPSSPRHHTGTHTHSHSWTLLSLCIHPCKTQGDPLPPELSSSVNRTLFQLLFLSPCYIDKQCLHIISWAIIYLYLIAFLQFPPSYIFFLISGFYQLLYGLWK